MSTFRSLLHDANILKRLDSSTMHLEQISPPTDIPSGRGRGSWPSLSHGRP